MPDHIVDSFINLHLAGAIGRHLALWNVLAPAGCMTNTLTWSPVPWPQEEEVQHGEAQQVAAEQHRAQWELDIVEKVCLLMLSHPL